MHGTSKAQVFRKTKEKKGGWKFLQLQTGSEIKGNRDLL